jgi:hypothetical protein
VAKQPVGGDPVSVANENGHLAAVAAGPVPPEVHGPVHGPVGDLRSPLLAGQVQRGEGERTEVRAGWGPRRSAGNRRGSSATWRRSRDSPTRAAPADVVSRAFILRGAPVYQASRCVLLVVSADGMRGRSRGCPLLCGEGRHVPAVQLLCDRLRTTGTRPKGRNRL